MIKPQNNKPNRRTLIFGIDGGTWSVLDTLIDQGAMPVLADLKRRGAWGVSTSVVPVNSAAAWSSILTGMPPEKHGVLDFLAWHPSGSGRTSVNATWIPRPTILDLMGEAGKVLALKIPMTYPTWPINGQMVSGMPTPDNESAFTYPQELAAMLNPMIEKGSAGRSWELEGNSRHAILDQMESSQRVLAKMTDYLIKSDTPDTCFVVARDIDELQHFFWDCLSGRDEYGYTPRLHKYFASIDHYLGRMLDWAGDDGRVMVISDHGFGPVEGVWHLNDWLQRRGFLSLRDNFQSSGESHNITLGLRLEYAVKTRARRLLSRYGIKSDWLARSLEKVSMRGRSNTDLQGINWDETLAYTGNVGEEFIPVYINLAGREPHGFVKPEQYEKVRSDLLHALIACEEPGILTVHRGDEFFDTHDLLNSGAPDLVIETISGAVQSDFALGMPQNYEASKYRNGCHRRQGMYLLAGPDVKPGEMTASLLDMPATIIGWMNQPVPAHFTGRVLTEFLPDLKTETEKTKQELISNKEYFTEEDEAGVRKKLESLGYL